MHYEDLEFRFCPVCGGNLKSTILKDKEPARLVCTQCEFVFYLDPKLVACAIVEMDNRVVLLRRGIQPQKGRWVIPGGYVDRGETVEAAALRETREECGVKIRIKRLLGVYSYPGRLAAVVVYLADYVSGTLIADDESEEVRLYRPDEIPWADLAFQSTVDALRDYRESRRMNTDSPRRH
ncbi:MAG: NUDIX hydrolase [Deltaproteobacteria bacterium]|jgi:8-oxo-dGTP diphosphatase